MQTRGEIQLFRVVDGNGNPARVALDAGVYRLAVTTFSTATVPGSYTLQVRAR